MSSGAKEWASERTNKLSGARERSEQCGASKLVSGASRWANRGANGLVFLASIQWSFYLVWTGRHWRREPPCLGKLTVVECTGCFAQTVFKKKRWILAFCHHGKCGKAAFCSSDTPISGQECGELLSLTILPSFDIHISDQNGIFTGWKWADLWYFSLEGKKSECITKMFLFCLLFYNIHL